MDGAARPRLVIGNWKMHLTPGEAVACARDLLPRLAARDDREVAVAPSFPALQAVGELLGDGPIALAAQDLSSEGEGPYTGEVSGAMLQDLGVRYVLVGHSERRHRLGETDRMVARKILSALESDLQPVVCVGEQEAVRESGRAGAFVRRQLLRAAEQVPAGQIHRLAVAYEPVWAIGTGKAASPADASEMHALLRNELEHLFGREGGRVRILYGGSVTPANIDLFMASPGIDGALVGGASLRAADFARIAAFHS